MLLNTLYLRNKNEICRIKRQHNEIFKHINCIPQRLILLCVSHVAIWLIWVKKCLSKPMLNGKYPQNLCQLQGRRGSFCKNAHPLSRVSLVRRTEAKHCNLPTGVAASGGVFCENYSPVRREGSLVVVWQGQCSRPGPAQITVVLYREWHCP